MAPYAASFTPNGDQQRVKAILDFIDEVRDSKLARDIELPEVVVCGDQSAGKSSFLHSLTGIEFPVSDDVCTRFATVLHLRDTPTAQFRAFLRPAPGTQAQEVERLAKFTPVVSGKEEIKGVIDAAREHLEVTQSGFSDHVLHLEASSPGNMNFTLMDLPGVFNSSSDKQSESDKYRVRKMVLGHIARPRSIIVYVRACHLSQAQQNLGDEIARVDPLGTRTFCVLTKPDKLNPEEEPTITAGWIDLLQRQQPCPYHVVKNRAFTQLRSTASEHARAEETFLNTGEWGKVSTKHKGIPECQRRLEVINAQNHNAVLPDVRDDLCQSLEGLRLQVSRMPTPPPINIREVLHDATKSFQDIVDASLRGLYDGDFFESLPDPRTDVSQLHQYVEARIVTLEEFVATSGRSRQTTQAVGEAAAKQLGGPGLFWAEQSLLQELTGKLKKAGSASRFNPTLAQNLFYDLVDKWGDHIDAFVEDVAGQAKEFVKVALAYVVKPQSLPRAGEFLAQRVQKDVSGRLRDLFAQLRQDHSTRKPINFRNVNSFSTRAQQFEAVRMSSQRAPGQRSGISRQHASALDAKVLVQVLGDEEYLYRSAAAATIIGAEEHYKSEVEKLARIANFGTVTSILVEQLSSLLRYQSIERLSPDQVASISEDQTPSPSPERLELESKIKTAQGLIAEADKLRPNLGQRLPKRIHAYEIEDDQLKSRKRTRIAALQPRFEEDQSSAQRPDVIPDSYEDEPLEFLEDSEMVEVD
ncbi:hypothetical protein A1O7_06968 [Cladophialophora yegresii CBS 114405]|uniref:Dynamin-type G domain-containing protein n=1 Tax=Cladophialophora yegresii CBS 114405 TaxID=1182544 RepID=W9WDL8_9EURO|nr:uncharacterized protein A1O7_06968 [Cladophialophora yegresii CBS 114405]EXJ56624.1 hypothetical protein A1O7_06968 [Cladophialophora yegresii CBS 114405]